MGYKLIDETGTVVTCQRGHVRRHRDGSCADCRNDGARRRYVATFVDDVVVERLVDGVKTPANAGEKRAAGLSLIAAGRTSREVAERVGVSERTVERWKHADH